MVVPMEKVSRADKAKRYVGNNLSVVLDSNRCGLQVTGNNCTVRISENSGRVKIVGDRCELTVLEGRGGIEYVGNGGKVHLGPTVSDDVLSYVGNEGEVRNVSARHFAEQSKNCDGQSARETGNAARSRTGISVRNSNVIRIATSCLPEGIDIRVPSIKIRGNKNSNQS